VQLTNAAVNGPDEEDFAVFRTRLPEYEHFYQHARAAFDTLGLKWDEIN
jgi:hypothetical protein